MQIALQKPLIHPRKVLHLFIMLIYYNSDNHGDYCHSIDLLQSDPSHITLQWILSLVEQYIRHHDNAKHIVYLVDLLPNLQCMVANSNIGQDCCNYLGQFEAKLPVAFALYFAVHEVSAVS